MPLWSLELIALAWLLYASWRIATVGAGRVLVGTAARLAAAIVAGFAAQLADRALGAITRNFVTRFALVAAVCVAVYVLLARWLLRRARRGDDALAAKIDARTPRVLRRGIVAAAVLALWVAALLALELGGRLVAVSAWRDKAARESLVLRPFLKSAPDAIPAATQPAPSTQPAELEEKLDLQRRFLTGFGRTIDRTRDYVAEATGADEFARQLDAVRRITNLPDHEREFLVRHNPDILALMNNPTVARVVRNERIGRLIDEVSAGSVTAVYRLGEEPDMQALMEDPQVRALLGKLDPVRMMEQVEAHRRERERAGE